MTHLNKTFGFTRQTLKYDSKPDFVTLSALAFIGISLILWGVV